MATRSDITKQKILEATFLRLAREGYSKLSIREIARDAGINHALVNYHFKSKDELVIAVLDDANRRLLERQNRMYERRGGYADKWAQAVRFYEVDLASGFVRVLIELYTASMSNESLREAFKPRIAAWYDMLRVAATEAIKVYGLEEIVTPEVASAWIGHFWMGMELSMLIGTPESVVQHRAAMDAFQGVLKRLDEKSGLTTKSTVSTARGRRFT